MERYESYKDSGVYYLHQLPSHWVVRRAKFLFREEKRPTRKNDEIITCFRDGQVTLRKNRRTEGFTNSLKEIGYKGIRKGDLVIHNMDAFAGSIGVSDSDGKGTPVYSICTPISNEISPYYYCYFLRYLAKCDFIKSLSKGIRERSTDFRFNDFKELSLPLPSINEQKAIVNYIDSVTSKIDEAISQQQKMIDLLNERKQIIIQNAVTKGLDPNAKMKDSGVEWIGEIPEDWEVRPIKTLLKLKKKLVGSNSNKFNLLSLSIDGIKIRDINNPMGKFPSSFDTYQEVNKNDFVFCNFDNEETPRAVGLSKVHGMITGAYDVMELYDLRVDIEYLYLVFLDIDNFKKFKPLYKGLRKTIPYDSFMSYKIAIPPLNEQREISKSLLVFLEKIDTSISQCNKMISLLQERKQIIINDVVTGKVKVV